MKTLMILIVLVTLTGCATSEESVVETCEMAGMTNIQPGSVVPFGCSDQDQMGRSFGATNANGKFVEGVVCCNVFRGCSIRFKSFW